MDLSKYKMIRSKNFPLKKLQKKASNPSNRPEYITTMALVCKSNKNQTYEVHIDNENHVLIFNEHEYLKRQFSYAFQLQDGGSNQDSYRMVENVIATAVDQCSNNLIVFNALDNIPVQHAIFSWKAYTQYRSEPDKAADNSGPPASAIRTIIQNVLKTKRTKTVVTLSILGIRSDGSLDDELNYQWIEQTKYMEDLAKIKQKTKLKVKKYKTEIKAFDLNRQHIREWLQAQQILYHYSQIKQYIQSWKEQLNPAMIPKIGQIYEILELQIDQYLGTIINVYKRKCLVKINQFMPQSSLVSMKLTQLLKQKIQNVQSISTRDFPFLIFLKQFFDKNKKTHYTILTQLGTNQTLKQQAICLTMDLQVPGAYVYLKHYCDKPDIIQQLKHKALTFFPMTSDEKINMKVQTANKSKGKMNKKSLNMLKQGQQIASKSFFFDTYSSNQKKKLSFSQTYNIQNELDEKKDLTHHIYSGSYSKHASYQRNKSNTVDKK